MIEIARLCAFLGFLILGLNIGRHRDPPSRQGAINLFLVYTITLSLSVGLTLLDAWPFSTYRLANQTWRGRAATTMTKFTFVGVDARGREQEVDPSAWSPVFPVVLQMYFTNIFGQLDATQRTELGRFLHERAERSRRAIHAGHVYGNERLLGRFAAPAWSLYQRHRRMPGDAWVGIRVYRDSWIPVERHRNPNAFDRKLELEYVAR